MSSLDPEWLDARIREKALRRKERRILRRDPNLRVIDASTFAPQLSKLAQTMANLVERQGKQSAPEPIPTDIGVILRQMRHTYGLLLYLNGDERRDFDADYRQVYSFVVLPVIRTMIDGFYNCTALLDDPDRIQAFRLSGLFRFREALRSDEARYGSDPAWKAALKFKKETFAFAMRRERITNQDLDDKKNTWPLLGVYLNQKPITPHKTMLRRFTLGFWKEYSSIAHASYDGLIGLYPFINGESLSSERRKDFHDFAEREITMHLGRAAAILLCLCTELQSYFKFAGEAKVDERLTAIWSAMLAIYEVKELYDQHFRSVLRRPI